MTDMKKSTEDRYELDNVLLHIDSDDDNFSLGFKDEDGRADWNFLPKSKIKTIKTLLSFVEDYEN